MADLKEEWKEANGYKISNYGVVIGKQGKPLKLSKNKGGYVICGIDLGHPYGMVISVHRAVAMLFIPNPENKPDINHIDANKENNRVDNLEWVTKKENMKHSSDNRLHPKTAYCCIVNDDKNIIETFQSSSEARQKYPKTQSDVTKSCKGKINSIYGLKFRFYDPETHTFTPTRFDDKDFKWVDTSHKDIRCIETGKIYRSQTQASKDIGISQSIISMMLRGEQSKNQLGLTFEYVKHE